ncbi:MAG: hypothetical protein ACO263_00145 [Cyclobacteriaceae bacterium]
MSERKFERIVYPKVKRIKIGVGPFLICIIFLFAARLTYSQPVRNTGYAVSPTVATMVRTGQIPVNQSAGVLQYSVPIYEVSLGNFKWPIQLNYSYSGLRLEELTGECGLGWTLGRTGGVVTREVRGLPDEHPRGYYGSESRRQYVEAFTSSTDMPLTIAQDFIAGKYDAEPDRFIVAVGNLSFSFFISSVTCSQCPLSDQHITVTPNAELAKVEFNWDDLQITDQDGNQYHFQEKERASFFSPDIYNQEKMQSYTSAWHLTSVKNQTGQEINLSYQIKGIQNIQHGEKYDRTASPNGERIQVNCAALGGNQNSGYTDELFIRDISHQRTWSVTELDVPMLSKLIWDDGNELEIIRAGEANANQPQVITGISIKNKWGRLIKSVSLDYDDQARPLLSRVVVDQIEVYDFDYHPVITPHIKTATSGAWIDPSQNPYAQDFWGFANGKGNATSIPELGGDRRPDFASTLQGALRSVNWPTGGFTQIFYEQNKVRISASEYLDLEPEGPNKEYTFSLQGDSYNNAASSKTFVFDKVTFARISHQAVVRGNSSQLTVNFGPLNCQGLNCQTYYSFASEMRSKFPEQAPRFYPVFGISLTGDRTMEGCGLNQVCVRESVSQWIRIEPGTYVVEASISNAEQGRFEMTIDYFDPDPEDMNPLFYEIPAAGIRIFRTKDCPDAGSESGCLQKIYRYVEEDGYGSGSYLSKLDREFKYQLYDAVDCRERSGTPDGATNSLPLYFEWDYPAIQKEFRSLNPILFNSGSPVYYSRVEVLDDAAATTGREIHFFLPSTWGKTGSYPYSPLPFDHTHGIAWKLEWRLASGALIKQQLSEHSVTGLPLVASPPPGIVFGKSSMYRYTPNLFPDQLETLLRGSILFKKYTPELPSRRLMASETEMQRSAQPAKKFYRYNRRLQLASDSIVNSDGTIIVTRFSYPPDIGDPAYVILTQQNRIGQPVVTTKWINGKQRELIQIRYQDWKGNGSVMEPVSTQITMDGTTFTKIQFEQYSTTGKPVSWIERDGIQRVLIWNNTGDQLLGEVFDAKSSEVFFTSFERGDLEGNSISGDGHSGDKSKTDGFVKSINALNPQTTYQLSWFEKNSSGNWQLRTQLVKPNTTGSYTITLAGQVDDIRFHPLGAQMTTYTSEPLLGITSKTDPNFLTSYYEYDSAGKLVRIRDSDRNITMNRIHQYGKKP